MLIIKDYKNEQLEVGLYEDYLIVSYIEGVLDLSILDGLELVSTIECSFLLLNTPISFRFLSEGLDNFYIPNEHKGGVIFLSKERAMTTWLWLIKQSIIPVSIRELERIALEENTLIYPCDCVQSLYFKEYEKAMNKGIIEKYERTPRGKRIEINTEDLFIHEVNNLQYFYFDLPRGSANKNAFITQNGQLVGRVVRGGFSFKRGKCRGLGYFFKKIEQDEKIYVGEYILDNCTIL